MLEDVVRTCELDSAPAESEECVEGVELFDCVCCFGTMTADLSRMPAGGGAAGEVGKDSPGDDNGGFTTGPELETPSSRGRLRSCSSASGIRLIDVSFLGGFTTSLQRMRKERLDV